MALHLHFRQTPELSYHFMKQYWRGHRYFKPALIVFILLFLTVIVNYILSPEESRDALASGIFAIVLVLALWLIFVPYFLKRQLRRSQKVGGMTDEREMILTEKEIIVKTNVSDTQFAWDAILRVQESDQCFFLYIASNQALLVPKSAFRITEEEEKFMRLLSEKGF